MESDSEQEDSTGADADHTISVSENTQNVCIWLQWLNNYLIKDFNNLILTLFCPTFNLSSLLTSLSNLALYLIYSSFISALTVHTCLECLRRRMTVHKKKKKKLQNCLGTASELSWNFKQTKKRRTFYCDLTCQSTAFQSGWTDKLLLSVF